MRPRRILILTHAEVVPPPPGEVLDEDTVARARWKTDLDVRDALLKLGHEVHHVGHDDDLDELQDELEAFRPHVVFNLLEHFRERLDLQAWLVGWLELRDQAYTGCNPTGLMFSTDKALQRKILRHHRIPVPDFFVVPRGRAVKRPKRFDFPLIVKSPVEHGSRGIAQASVVSSDAKLVERVEWVHERLGSAAIVEEYIEGREIYLGVLGNRRIETFPSWELRIEKLAEGAPNIATSRLKWDVDYQERVGLEIEAAKDLPEGAPERIARLCRRAYHVLQQTGYARFDLRVSDEGRIVLIESNPNPDLAWDAEYASAAKAAGLEYPQLLQRILSLGIRWRRERSR